MTIQQIINLALKKIGVLGVGMTAQAEDSNDALTELNMMLAEWQTRRWLVYGLQDSAFTSTGAVSYTVGAGGNFNITRPDRLEAAFFRQIINANPANIDYPLEILQAREDYNRITLKTLTSFPQFVFYDAAYPLGNAFFWPVPLSGTYELHLTTKVNLNDGVTLSQVLSLPDNYQGVLTYSLAERLVTSYGLPPDQKISLMASAMRKNLRLSNAQVPRLGLPSDLKHGGFYNVYADRVD